MVDATPVFLASVPPILRICLTLAGFWAVAIALGRRCLILLRVPKDALSLAERGVLCAALGAGFLQFLPYGLGAAGVLSQRSVLIGWLVLTALLAPDLWALAQAARRVLRGFSPRRPPAPVLAWWLLALALLAAFFVHAVAVKPFGDDDGYHLAAPRRWLQEGTLSYLPSLTVTNASNGFEMLFAIGLSLFGPLGVKTLHYSAGVFTLLAVYLTGKRLGSPIAGLVTASVLLASGVMQFTISVAFVDLAATWLTVMSVLAWLAFRDSAQRSLLVCMALFAGFAASFKLTSLMVGIAWIPTLLWEARRARLPPGRVLTSAIALGLLVALPVIPWSIRSYQVTGNPIFPMFSGVFATRDWDAGMAQLYTKYLHYYAWGVASGAKLSEAMRRLIVLGAAAGVLSIAAVAFFVIRNQVLRCLITFCAVYFTISILVAGIVTRYWFPGTAIVTLVLSVWALDKWSFGFVRPWLAPLIVARGVFQYVTLPHSLPELTMQARIATGAATVDEAFAADEYWRTWKVLNTEAAPDANVLAAAFYTSCGASSFGGFWTNRTFFVTDPHIQQFINLESWENFVRSLERAKIQYVVVFARRYNEGRIGFSFPAADNEYPFSRRLVEEYGEKLSQFEDVQLYRVRLDKALAVAGTGSP
jgi:hypothetical protein